MATVLDTLFVEGSVSSTVQGKLLGSFGEMPTPSEENEGFIVFYNGPAGGYVPLSFYICRTDDDGASYYWHPLVLSLDTTASLVKNAVPNTRTINGKPLSKDIKLTASDVEALPSTTKVPTKVSELMNDGVFITQDVSTLANYFTKEQTGKILKSFARILVVDDFPDDDAIDPNAFYSVLENGVRKLYYRADGKWTPVA